MKRLSQKFKWKVNVGCDREDEIARQLASLASDSAYTDLEQEIEEERQTPEARARSVDPEYFSVLDWSIVLMTYENWRNLEPKPTPFLVKAFSETLTNGSFSQKARETPELPHFPSEQHFQDHGPPSPTETRPLDPRGASCARHTIMIHDRKVLRRPTVSPHE